MNVSSIQSWLLHLARWQPARAASTARPRCVSLRRNQLITVSRASTTGSVAVSSGTVWLTGTPAQKDILLASHDSFQFAGRRPYVIEALTDAEIVLFP